jgi:hypothetical protein
LVAFKKPSPRLLTLRTTERRLAIMQMFERAKKIRGEAEALEARETGEAQQRAIARMKINFRNLEDRHQRDATGLADLAALHIQELEMERAASVDPLRLTVARLEPDPPPRPRRAKDGVWPEYAFPESPRQVPQRQAIREARPGEPLPLAGIQVRQYVKTKKDDRKPKEKKKHADTL